MTAEWVPVGSIKGPQGPPGMSIEVIPFSMQGSLRPAESVGRFPIAGGTYIDAGGFARPVQYRIETVAAAVEDPPLGAPIIIDLRVNGESVYSDPDARPHIFPGDAMAVVGEHEPVILGDGDYLNCDVVAVGTIFPGTFLTVATRLRRGGRDTNPAAALPSP